MVKEKIVFVVRESMIHHPIMISDPVIIIVFKKDILFLLLLLVMEL